MTLDFTNPPHCTALLPLQNCLTLLPPCLQLEELDRSCSSAARSSAAGLQLLAGMVEAVTTGTVNVSTLAALGSEYVDSLMARINFLADSWTLLAPAAAWLEEYQRASGFIHLLTVAEMRQLCLLTQRQAAARLVELTQGVQRQLALRRTALAASRQLCSLQPGSAAYLLHQAAAISEMEVSNAKQRDLVAYRAARQAATAEKGEAGGACLR